MSPHGLRRARATHLANVERWPIAYVQRLMGHTSINTTQHYVSVNDDMVRDYLMKKYKNQ
jgi:integrase